jgi:hypothetical protein
VHKPAVTFASSGSMPLLLLKNLATWASSGVAYLQSSTSIVYIASEKIHVLQVTSSKLRLQTGAAAAITCRVGVDILRRTVLHTHTGGSMVVHRHRFLNQLDPLGGPALNQGCVHAVLCDPECAVPYLIGSSSSSMRSTAQPCSTALAADQMIMST